MANDTIKIIIETNPKWKPLRAAYSALWIIGIIGVGVAVDSSAMQWAGFVLSAIFALAIGIRNTVIEQSGMTVQEAKEKIAKIEKGEI